MDKDNGKKEKKVSSVLFMGVQMFFFIIFICRKWGQKWEISNFLYVNIYVSETSKNSGEKHLLIKKNIKFSFDQI